MTPIRETGFRRRIESDIFDASGSHSRGLEIDTQPCPFYWRNTSSLMHCHTIEQEHKTENVHSLTSWLGAEILSCEWGPKGYFKKKVNWICTMHVLYLIGQQMKSFQVNKSLDKLLATPSNHDMQSLCRPSNNKQSAQDKTRVKKVSGNLIQQSENHECE